MPRRIQLQRKKGWRKPPGVVTVSRPSKWGSPFAIGAPSPDTGEPMARDEVVARCRTYFADWDLSELRGKDLACWCAPELPCHADVLLELANR